MVVGVAVEHSEVKTVTIGATDLKVHQAATSMSVNKVGMHA